MTLHYWISILINWENVVLWGHALHMNWECDFYIIEFWGSTCTLFGSLKVAVHFAPETWSLHSHAPLINFFGFCVGQTNHITNWVTKEQIVDFIINKNLPVEYYQTWKSSWFIFKVHNLLFFLSGLGVWLYRQIRYIFLYIFITNPKMYYILWETKTFTAI